MTLTVQDIKPAQIKPHPSNPRTDLGDLAELVTSIREHGVLEPLLVIPDVESKAKTPRYLMLAGHRRLEAAKQAGMKALPCMVRDDIDDPAGQIATMLVENLQRADLTPVEEARAYQQLLEFPDWNQKAIVQRTGRSASTVRSRLALTKLPNHVQEKIGHQVTLADAGVLAEFADDPATVQHLERYLGTPNWPWAVERARRDRDDAKKRDKIAKQLRAAGVRVVTDAQLEELDEAEYDRADAAEVEPNDQWVLVVELSDTTVAEHGSCEGHAVVIDGAHLWGVDDDGQPIVEPGRVVCMRPDIHAERRAAARAADPDAVADTETAKEYTAGVRDAEAKRQAAEKAAAEQRARDLDVAATVRRAHLAAVIADGDVDIATANLRQMVIEHVNRWQDHQRWNENDRRYATALLVPGQAIVDVPQLRAAVDKLNLAQLALTLFMLLHSRNEEDLRDGDGWPVGGSAWRSDACHEWRVTLGTVYGYEWSDIELELGSDHAGTEAGDGE